MKSSKFNLTNLKLIQKFQSFPTIQSPTIVFLSILAVISAIAIAWFEGQPTITNIFAQIQVFESNPPIWLQVPIISSEYLLAATAAIVAIVIITIKIYPQARNWSRFLVIGILLLLIGRYISWRLLSSLNLSTPLNGIFSLGLLVMEMLPLAVTIIELLLGFNISDRRPEAAQMSAAVIAQKFTPSVDILIPTYN